ncbi:hypothetical protein V3C99_002965, partial [Haemonchus contortus]
GCLHNMCQSALEMRAPAILLHTVKAATFSSERRKEHSNGLDEASPTFERSGASSEVTFSARSVDRDVVRSEEKRSNIVILEASKTLGKSEGRL